MKTREAQSMNFSRLPQLITKLALAIVMVFALAATSVMAQSTYFVSTSSGNDAFNGTQANVGVFPAGPFQTIGAAMRAATDGDTISIEAGTYAEDWTIDDDLTVLATADGPNVTVTVGNGDGNAITMVGGAVAFNGGGAVITMAGAGDLDLNGGTLTLAAGAFTVQDGATIFRSEGSLAGSAPTFDGAVSVTYDDLTGTPGTTAGIEVPASLGGGTLLVLQEGGSVTIPNALSAGIIDHDGEASLSFSADLSASGLIDLDGGNTSFAGVTANAGITSDGGTFTATSVTIDNGDNWTNSSGSATVSRTTTIQIDSGDLPATRITNSGDLTLNDLVFAFVDTDPGGPGTDVTGQTVANTGDLSVGGTLREAATVASTNAGAGRGDVVSAPVTLSNSDGGFVFTNSVSISGAISNIGTGAGNGFFFNAGGSVGGDVTNANGGEITIGTGATLSLTAGAAFATVGVYLGSGTLSISAGGDIDIGGIDSAGNVTLESGTGATDNGGTADIEGNYTINNEGTHTGTVMVDANLVVAADPVNFSAAVTVNGNATLDADGTGDGPTITGAFSVGGTATFDGDTTVTAAFDAANAVINDALILSSTDSSHDVTGTLTVNGTMAMGGGASDIEVTTTSIAAAGSFTLGAGNTYTAMGDFTGGAFDGTGTGSELEFDLPSGTTTFSPGPNTAVNDFSISGNERTLTITQGFEVQNDLTVGDDATLELTNELIRMTATDGDAIVTVDDDAHMTASSNSGALSFEGASRGDGPTFTVTSDVGGTAIGTLTNIIVSMANGDTDDVLFDEDVTMTGVVSLVAGGVTVQAGDVMTFSGDAAGISINVGGTATAITGTTAGVYDLTYAGAGAAAIASGAEFSDPGTNVIDDLTVSSTGGIVTLTGPVGINGNFTVGATSEVALAGGALTVGGNVAINATDASDGTVGGTGLTLVGAGAVHTFDGDTKSLVSFEANATATGTADGDRESSMAAVTVDAGVTVSISGLQEITGDVIVNGNLTISLSDSDGAATDDQDIEGTVFVYEGGSLTFGSDVEISGATVDFGDGGAGSAGLDMGGNQITLSGGRFTADADASLGTTGTLRLIGGADVGTDETGSGVPANLPNLFIDDAGTAFTSDVGVVDLNVDQDFTIGIYDLFISGDATFIDDGADDVNITGTTGRVIATGTSLTMSEDVYVPNFGLQSTGTTSLASSSSKTTFNWTVLNDGTGGVGEAQFDSGTLDIGVRTNFILESTDGASESLFDYNGGTITSGGGNFVVDDDGADGGGGADFDLAGTGGTLSIPRLTVNILGAATADADDGLDLGNSDVITVTSRIEITGGTIFTDDGTTDGSIVVADDARIVRDMGVFEQTPTFGGTGIDVEYDGAVTTDNELPATFDELQIDAATTIEEGVSITVNTIDVNATLAADGTADDGDQTVTLTDGGTVEISVTIPLDGASDDGEIVYAGAFNLVYDAAQGDAVTTESVFWAGTPASVTVANGLTAGAGQVVTLNANKSTGSVAVGDDDTLALATFNLTVGGALTGGANMTSNGGAIVMSGTVAQTLAGPLTLPSLTVNNGTGVTLTGGNLTISTSLNLMSGTLDTGTNMVILPHTGTAGQGFTRTTGYVTGTVRKQIQGGTAVADRMVFPTGVNPYRPLAITFNNPGQISALAASGIFITVTHTDVAAGGANNLPLTTVDDQGADLTIARYPDFFWTVSTSSTLSPNVSYDIELNAGGFDSFVGEGIERTRTIRRQGGAATNFWTLVGGGVAGNNDNYAASLTNPVTVVRNAVGALIATPGVIFTMGLESNMTVTDPGAVTVNEGATSDIDLTTVFGGGSGAYTYTITSADDATATGATAADVLTVSGVAAGSTTLTVLAVDELNDSRTSTVTVTVNPALAATAVDAVALNAGGTSTVDLSAVFSGGASPVTYAVSSSDAAAATGAESGGTLTITAVAAGSATITVTGTDATGQTADATVAVTVNAAMAATDPAAITLTEGATADVDLSTVFAGGDGSYTFAVSSAADANVTGAEAAGTLTVTAVDAYAAGTTIGTTDVTVTATDGTGDSVTATVSVDVIPVVGDLDGSGAPSAASASIALDYFLGLTTLTDKQVTAADFNGDGTVNAFDAALIFDAFLNGKVELASNVAASLEFGEVEHVDGMVNIPITLSGDLNDVVAISFSANIDPAIATIVSITSDLDEGWIIKHVISEDGDLRIAAAGLSGVATGGIIATISVQLTDAGASFDLVAEGAVNNNATSSIDAVEIVELPDTFTLQGNYPNPFNPSTTIQFDLPETAEVEVQVFDMVGRVVMTLPSQSIQAGANRSLQLNASQLASGSYFYRVIARMESKTLVDTGRMLLVK